MRFIKLVVAIMGLLSVKIKIQTKVEADLPKVKAGFTQSLFLKLNPPFPPVELKEFGGCETGDKVALELNFLLFKQLWVSDIIDHGENQIKWFFVDRGVQLPFFLSSWTHRHIAKECAEGTEIIDDIQFSTGTVLTDMLFYPVLYLQFLYRKPIYKKFFKG